MYWLFNSTDDFTNLVRMHLTRIVQQWQGKLAGSTSTAPPKPETGAPSPASTAEPVDEDEPGLLELSEEVAEKFQEATEVVARIAKATESIGKKIQGHAQRTQAGMGAGAGPPRAARRVIGRAAKDMSDYAAKLSQEIPHLRDLMQAALESLSKAISLWPEFIQVPSQRQQMMESIPILQDLRRTLSTTGSHLQTFLDSVNGLPPLTVDLNRAKRLVRTELEGLIELVRSQEALLVQSETAATSVLSREDNR